MARLYPQDGRVRQDGRSEKLVRPVRGLPTSRSAQGRRGLGVAGAPRRGGLLGPPPEGAGEGTRLGIFQGCCDLTQGHVGVSQQLARDLETNFVRHLPERKPLGAQVPRQGTAVHRKETGDRRRGAGVPEEFGPKQTAQIPGERAGDRGRLWSVCPVDGWHLHRSFLLPDRPAAGEPTPSYPVPIRPLDRLGLSLDSWGSPTSRPPRAGLP